MEELALKLVKITKKFGNFYANEDVDLSIRKGEVHALIGENGAGKSTLMNVVAGVYKQTSGDVYINGEKVELNSPNDALKKGVGMIYQHFKLVENMTVLENIIGGTSHRLFVNKKEVTEKIQKLLEQTGMEVPLHKLVKDLSISEKQIVEIVKVLYRGADLLILDEVLGLVDAGLLQKEELENLVKSRSGDMDLILTGRNMDASIREYADEIYKIKSEK